MTAEVSHASSEKGGAVRAAVDYGPGIEASAPLASARYAYLPSANAIEAVRSAEPLTASSRDESAIEAIRSAEPLGRPVASPFLGPGIEDARSPAAATARAH